MPLMKVNDIDTEGIAEREAEYNQLKLALHLAQTDRTHYMEEMQTTIVKMKKTIEDLEKERAELLESITAVDSKPNQQKDQRTCEDLANLAENKDWLDHQVALEKSKHIEFDSKIKELEKRLNALHLKVGGANTANDLNDKLKRKLTTLEGRLVHVLKTYNDALGRNMQLRAEIDTLRMERARFDLLYRKMDETLTKLREEIGRLVESTTHAYEQREEASLRIQQLTEKSEKDNQQHNTEVKELVRLIDHDRKLKAFMKIKVTERQEDPQLTAWKAKRAQEADERRAEVQRCITSYETAFERMLQLIEETSTDRLVESFLQKEDRNFALFNYVSEVNGEIEHLCDENNKLSAQIDEYKDWVNDAVGTRRHALSELNDANKAATEAQLATQNQLESTQKSLDRIAQLVAELVDKMECDKTMLTRRLASSNGVTQANLLDYLALVEERVNTLLQVRQFIAINDPEAPYVAKTILIGSNLTAPPGPIAPIMPPNLQDDFDDGVFDSAALCPHSREDLHKRVVSLVLRKERDARVSMSQTTAFGGSGSNK